MTGLFYTYLWMDRNGAPFYVGKGTGKRAWQMTKRSRDFKAVHSLGGCTVEIIDQFVLESEAFAHECMLIERYGRIEFGGCLVNKTDGGEGPTGQIMSLESRDRIRAARVGKKLSPEHRAKISEGCRNPSDATRAKLRSRKRTPEQNAKIGAALMGREVSNETREKLRKANVGKNLTDEHREKIRLAAVGRKVSAAHREKIRAANVGKRHTAETRAKITRSNILRHGARRAASAVE